MKNIRVFYLKIFIFLEMKFSIYLNRRVFVMTVMRSLFPKASFLSFVLQAMDKPLLIHQL